MFLLIEADKFPISHILRNIQAQHRMSCRAVTKHAMSWIITFCGNCA